MIAVIIAVFATLSVVGMARLIQIELRRLRAAIEDHAERTRIADVEERTGLIGFQMDSDEDFYSEENRE